MTDDDGPLRELLEAIAAGDDQAVLARLRTAPRLAREAMRGGASRASPRPHFLTQISCYIYAGDSALHIAAAAYRPDLVDRLIGLGADVNARNRRGAQPLHYAAVGVPGSGGWNPVAQAKTIARLIAAGADANGLDMDGVAPLHRAVRTRCAAAIAALLDGGADAERRNASGSSPLDLASRQTGRGGSGSPQAKAQQAKIVALLSARGSPA